MNEVSADRKYNNGPLPHDRHGTSELPEGRAGALPG